MQEKTSSHWVDALFARLFARYGDAWLRKWDGVPPQAMKADWSAMLQPFQDRHPGALDYAIDNLPQWPPNSDEFARICRNAPSQHRALEAPKGKRDPAKLQELLTGAAKAVTGHNPRAYLLERLEAREKAGTMTPAHRHQLECLRRNGMGIESQPAPGAFTPIPQDLWPWVQRGQAPVSVSP